MLPKDVRYALRLFAKSPGYVAMAVLALGLGIGANSSIFSFVNVYLLNPLPAVKDANRIVILQNQRRGNPNGTSYLDFADWEQQSRSFDGMAAIQYVSPVIVGLGEPERADGVRVSAGFFRVFAANPVLGRLFLPAETAPGGEPVMIISHGFWQRKLGSSPGVIGRSLTLDGVTHKIVGVLPDGFRFSWQDTNFYAPLMDEVTRTPRGRRQFAVLAKLKSGAVLVSSQAEMNTIAGRLETAYPETNSGMKVAVLDLLHTIGDGPRESVTVCMGIVVFVLLIACSNVANLQLARATGRANEVAVRIAMGATRWRIVRQMVTESVLVALAGGVLGLGLGYAGCKILMAATPPMIHPFHQDFMDSTVLAFTAALSVLTGIVSGIAPAFQVSRVAVTETLKEGGRSGTATGSRGRLRCALAVVEVSLAMMLLLAAGLLIKSFAQLQQTNPGFRVQGLLLANVGLPDAKYPKPENRAAFFRDLVDRLQVLPGVTSAAASTGIPLAGGGGAVTLAIEGLPAPPPGQELVTRFRSITSGYFEAMGIPLRRGRAFTAQDAEGASGVVIVNERFVRQFLAGPDPIGKRIKWSRDKQFESPWTTIVGITADIQPFGPSQAADPEMYAPFRQEPRAVSWLVVRTAVADASFIAPAVRAALRELDREQPIAQVQTMEHLMGDAQTLPHMMTVMTSIFAVIALIMAAMGIYGVVSYSVAQRTHEIGIRMAMGAGSANVVRLVLRQALWVIAIGVGAGVPAAAGVTTVLQSFLFGVGARDPLTFVSVPLVLAAVALIASYLPARRATRLDPISALRFE